MGWPRDGRGVEAWLKWGYEAGGGSSEDEDNIASSANFFHPPPPFSSLLPSSHCQCIGVLVVLLLLIHHSFNLCCKSVEEGSLLDKTMIWFKCAVSTFSLLAIVSAVIGHMDTTVFKYK